MRNLYQKIQREIYQRKENFIYKNQWQRIHIDRYLLTALVCLILFGLLILFSAVNSDEAIIIKQLSRLALAFVILFLFAQIAPRHYQHWSPWIYTTSLLLLIAVLIIGHISKGAQRWINLGLFHVQPSEMMKLAVPMMLAWYFSNKTLPARLRHLISASIIILVPTILTAKQPDLGTAVIILMTGGGVIIFAGISWRLLGILMVAISASTPILWHFMHAYQRSRILTFLDPEKDPLGNGYHIIQSKIAIGSGGLFGKGFMQGTQSRLHFLRV